MAVTPSVVEFLEKQARAEHARWLEKVGPHGYEHGWIRVGPGLANAADRLGRPSHNSLTAHHIQYEDPATKEWRSERFTDSVIGRRKAQGLMDDLKRQGIKPIYHHSHANPVRYDRSQLHDIQIHGSDNPDDLPD